MQGDLQRECAHCGVSDWHVYAQLQPILGLVCGGCAAKEWVGFLEAEWVEHVLPVYGKRTHGQAGS